MSLAGFLTCITAAEAMSRAWKGYVAVVPSNPRYSQSQEGGRALESQGLLCRGCLF